MDYYKTKLSQIQKDEHQYAAYLSGKSTVVIAGPGSGKTTVLTLKIIQLLREKIKEPRGLACVTFSREAVREFKSRLCLMGYKPRANVFLGTVHAFCISEVLGPFAQLYDIDLPFPIQIVAQSKKNALFKTVVSDLKLDNLKLKPSDMDKERRLNINGQSNVKIEPYEVALKIGRKYEKRLHESGYVDFEDIVNYSTLLIQQNSYVRECLNAKFPWILIDEYQDLGRPLHEMILSLFSTTDINIFAVGDPDQSIYGFQGAIPDYLMELYNNEKINPIKLVNNYRSNQEIVNGSELVLNKKRGYTAVSRLHEKADYVFVTCEEEMQEQFEFVANNIIPYFIKEGVPLEEIAVLVGSNPEVTSLSAVFKEKSISYYISKHEFERSDFVKWLETCALWVVDKTQASFSDIYDFWEKLLVNHGHKVDFKNKIKVKRGLYEVLEASEEHRYNLKEWTHLILTALDIFDLLKDSSLYPDEIENIKTLLQVIEQEEGMYYTIEQFSKLGKPSNQVTISTRHSSKGLEFEVIILLGMEEGRFPAYWKTGKELEEENRVCFVCISRAKKACILVRSKYHTYNTKDGRLWRKPHNESPFWRVLKSKYDSGLTEEMFE